jgi:glycerol-3-phosphate acyltransferase PlsY
MHMLTYALVLILAYIIGSIPSGLLIVKLTTGKDIRAVASGRTGGTNAMRAAGPIAGAATGIMDLLKGAAAVWLALLLMPDAIWLRVFAPFMAVLGHNYSIFLTERDERGRLRLRGGAGTGPNVGAAMAFWLPFGLVALPLIGFFVFIVGYASLASIAAGFAVIITFYIRAVYYNSPIEYSVYGVLTTLLIIFGLLPNIRRLLNGTERRVGVFAKMKHPNK